METLQNIFKRHVSTSSFTSANAVIQENEHKIPQKHTNWLHNTDVNENTVKVAKKKFKKTKKWSFFTSFY